MRYLGLGGRLVEGPAPEMVEAGFALECADAPILHAGLALADLAQTAELAEIGRLPDAEAHRLAAALIAMSRVPPAEFPYEPGLGDAWNSWRRELERRAGAAAGWLSVGRPRREAGRVAFRLALRRRVLTAHEALTGLGRALLDQARAHRRSVMADHTYLQPAQPTTFGYLLLAHLFPVLRDGERLRRAFAWVNLSPAGAGGVGGSSVPLDRRRLARRLGFDGVAVHARDAMWQTDGLVELLAAVAGAATHAGQIAADLEVLASPAFGFVELADSLSRASALMPQKKNPYPLAVVRGAGGVLGGRLAGLLSVLRTGSARTDHFLFGYGELVRGLDLFAGTQRLLAATVASLRVDRRALAASARAGFLGAAELAEGLVLGGWLDHDTAHRLVGAAVRAAVAEGRDRLRPGDLVAQARRLGHRLPADGGRLAALVEAAADPLTQVRSRVGIGGTAPAPVAAMLRQSAAGLRREEVWRQRAAARIQAAETALLDPAARPAPGP